MTDCTPAGKRQDCGATDTPAETACSPFSICVGNNTLDYDGTCLTVSPGAFQIPDGTYSQITFSGGCIVGVGQAPVAGYTPNACCGAPGSTGSDEGDEGSTSNANPGPSPMACNWLQQTAAGLAVTPVIQGSGSVVVSGCGTAGDPLVISIATPEDGTDGLYVTSSTHFLDISGEGTFTNPLVINVTPSGVVAGTYEGFTVNAYGLITDYTAPTTSTVRMIIESPTVSVTEVTAGSGVYTIDLKDVLQAAMSVDTGPATLNFNTKGQLTGATVNPAITPGKFYSPAAPDGSVPAQIISFDAQGTITSVQPA